MTKLKIEAAQRLVAAPDSSRGTQVLKQFVQAIVGEEGVTATFTIKESDPIAKVVGGAPGLNPGLMLDAASAKVIAALLARHPGSEVWIDAVGNAKLEIRFVDDSDSEE